MVRGMKLGLCFSALISMQAYADLPSSGCRLNISPNINDEAMHNQCYSCPTGRTTVHVWHDHMDVRIGIANPHLDRSWLTERKWCGKLWGYRGSDVNVDGKIRSLYVAPGAMLEVFSGPEFTGTALKFIGVEGGTRVNWEELNMGISSFRCSSSSNIDINFDFMSVWRS